MKNIARFLYWQNYLTMYYSPVMRFLEIQYALVKVTPKQSMKLTPTACVRLVTIVMDLYLSTVKGLDALYLKTVQYILITRIDETFNFDFLATV